MKGYPKYINTKQDVYNALEVDESRTKDFLQNALDSRDGWYVTGSLSSETDGITDETHRVVDQSEEGDDADWYQQEYGPRPGNTLDRLGMTVAEAEDIIQG